MSNMIGFKKPLATEMLGHKQPLGSMLGTKKPLENIKKIAQVTQELGENKKVGGLEKARRGNGHKLGQWA